MRTFFMVLALIIGLTSAAANSETLWSVGQRDMNYKEFAAAGKFSEYARDFPNDVHYVIGQSALGKDWPFIHPGPSDDWAGSKEHPFEITFDLPQVSRKAYRLTICTVDVHSTAVPVMRVQVNEGAAQEIRWPAGKGDSSLIDPKQGGRARQSWVFSPDLLHRGRNVITLTLIQGSWLLYDAVSLESTNIKGVELGDVKASNTPFFRKIGDGMKQAVRVMVENEGLSGEAELMIEGLPETAQKATLEQGHNVIHLLTTPFEAAAKHSVTVRAGNKTFTADFEGRPERHWKLFVAASAHTDIGYTDLQDRIFDRHRQNTTAALNACDANPDFKWNLEVFAQSDWYSESGADSFARLESRIKEGRIGVTALYLNMLTGLCNGEEMVRVLTPAQVWGRERNVPVKTAVITDVPTMIGTLPMFLSQAGVQYVVDGINADRGPVWPHIDPRMYQSPFWWEGLDGSRVMALFTKTYGQAHTIGLRESVAAVEEKLPEWLEDKTREDYPSDAMYINGAFWDNESVNAHYADVVKEWNQTWDFPQFVIVRPDEYFEYIEQHFGKDLPVFRGDMGSYWEDGAASTAMETGMARRAKAELMVSERWLALAAAQCPQRAYPVDKIQEAWDNTLYFDEHTWGAAGSISAPDSDQSMQQWAYKAAYAHRALEQADGLGALGVEASAALAGTACTATQDAEWILVRNALSWARDILVSVPAAESVNAARNAASNERIATYRHGGFVEFVAKAVPPMGYTWYHLEKMKSAETAPLLQSGADAYHWESARYKIVIDTRTGGLKSLADKVSGREWVSDARGFAINQFLYVLGGDKTSLIHPGDTPAPPLQPITHTATQVELVLNTPVHAVLRLQREGSNLPNVQTDIDWYADGRIGFRNVVKKQPTMQREAGYFAFPIKLDPARNVRSYMDLPYGVVDVEHEQMPGACREWFAVNTFAATGDDQACAYIASREAPMFTVGNMVRGLWPGTIDNNDGTVFAYVFNNYWHTNYKASQGGDIPFAFSLSLTEAPFDPVAGTRFGYAYTTDAEAASAPLAADRMPRGAAEDSLVSIPGSSVILAELTHENGRLIARLYNPSFELAQADLTLPTLNVVKAWKTDLLGKPEEELPRASVDAPIAVKVPARGMCTVVLEIK